MRKILLILMIAMEGNSWAIEVTNSESATLIKPIGYINHRRPPSGANTVTILDHSLQFSAQQVCGYTDWSTAVLKLPKELLTLNYWKNVGARLGNQAKEAVLAITGALPSMLVCNVSPTFCSIMNRAEALAQASLKFTFDSCQMLEGISDVTKTQFAALGTCVKNKTDSGKAANVAIDMCALRDDAAGSSKAEKSSNASAQAGPLYDVSEFFKEACHETEHYKYSSSSHSYSVAQQNCKWMKSFLPGISVDVQAKVKHGGTCPGCGAESLYEGKVEATGKFLVDLSELMFQIRYGIGPYTSQGPLPRHEVISHRDVWERLGVQKNGKLKGICYPDDGPSCVADITTLPPVYRFSRTGALPSLMIHPATLYELIEAIPNGSSPRTEYERKDSQVSYIFEHLMQSLAYATSSDMVNDSYIAAVNACSGPEFQNAGAQADCSTKIDLLKREGENLRSRNETDKNHILSQLRFYEEIERLKSQKITMSKGGKAKGIDPIMNPSEL